MRESFSPHANEKSDMDRNRMIECEKLYTISDGPLNVRKKTRIRKHT